MFERFKRWLREAYERRQKGGLIEAEFGTDHTQSFVDAGPAYSHHEVGDLHGPNDTTSFFDGGSSGGGGGGADYGSSDSGGGDYGSSDSGGGDSGGGDSGGGSD